jgi:hypothetical protein
LNPGEAVAELIQAPRLSTFQPPLSGRNHWRAQTSSVAAAVPLPCTPVNWLTSLLLPTTLESEYSIKNSGL